MALMVGNAVPGTVTDLVWE